MFGYSFDLHYQYTLSTPLVTTRFIHLVDTLHEYCSIKPPCQHTPHTIWQPPTNPHYHILQVREFTGDMQLTKREVEESQLLVTTPEKYDVVTRKGGDGSLGTMVSLIIIDEVHLLAGQPPPPVSLVLCIPSPFPLD